MENLKWYVLRKDFNTDKIEQFNIFDHWKFTEAIEEALKKYENFDTFKENVKKELMYYFWCKSEYEILITDLFVDIEKLEWDDFEKIDIYSQVLPNLDILCRYIIEEYNKKKRNKLEI